MAVIRDVELLNYSGSTAAAQLYVTVPGPLNATFAYYQLPATIETTQWKGRVVANAGDVIGAYIATADNSLVISGYLLSTT